MKAFCDEREHVFDKRIMKNGIDWLNERSRGVYLRQGSLRRVSRAVAVGIVGISISVSAQLVSNLGEAEGAFVFPLTQGQHASNAFTTGSNIGGYTLDSVTIAIRAVNGSPNDLVVAIHTASGSNAGAVLEDLAGVDPSAAGNHTFTSAGITLDPNTTYHIRLGSPTSNSSNSYNWSTTGSDAQTSSDGWVIADASRETATGLGAWSAFSGGESYRFSIQATPVPEPHEYAMFVSLGLIGFVAARRHMVSKALA